MSFAAFDDSLMAALVVCGVAVAIGVSLAVLVHPITLAIVVLAPLVGVGARAYIERVDAKRRDATRKQYEERVVERERAALLCEIERYFPFLRAPLNRAIQAGLEPEDGFWQALAEAPASELGVTFAGLPALLPTTERSKHLYVVGKTGSGKTSLLLHLIREDLEAGRGVVVMAPEAELFRDWLLPLVPPERRGELVYFAPGHADNPVTLNPFAVETGDDPRRTAGQLFAVFKRAFGDEDLGTRVTPILGNAIACLAGQPGATLWDMRRLLLDPTVRERMARATDDGYVREFWLSTYPTYPRGSHLPILNRLDQFLRPPPIRRAFCHPVSSFSIRSVLERQGILFLDLSRLDPESMRLLGQLLLASFQLELMRREVQSEPERQPVHLYADEFQSFAGVAEGTWRELLSRGRRYGLALTLAHQHPSQLSLDLQQEILGNVASIVAFSLSAKDAYAVRREFIEEDLRDGSAQPIAQETLIGLKVGRAVARLGSGAFSIPLETPAPGQRPSQAAGAVARAHSWETHGIPLSERVRYEPEVKEDETSKQNRTRAAPPLCTGDGVVLGANTHGSKTVDVALTDKQRTQHLYVIGASGTGKSTFLLNCIAQGMQRGEGLAVLDPHGDLIDQILALVAQDRHDDVVLVDPADREYPVGFNVLRAHSELEKELLASDLVSVFRRLSTRWGDQMNSVLANAILAFLESDTGGTLLDMRKFLVEAEYRKVFLRTVQDEDVRYYWEREFPLLPGRPQAPLLTRLDTFLRPKLIRNMVSQRDSALDFGHVMDSGGIFLGKLSQGAIGEENAYLLGSMMVSKFYQMALSRQAIDHDDRRPFFLYIDECHHFLTPSMASILSGTRKYGLGLVLAHQELQQVSGRDADILSAVISNPYTRVCFRVGDLDAKKLEKGFAHFDAKDLQSLGVGEAICRVERADFDFNLKTAPMPEIDAAAARAQTEDLVALSRTKYATPREDLTPKAPHREELPKPISFEEAIRRKQQTTPPRAELRRTEKAGRAAETPPTQAPASSPGRGGPRHKQVQSVIKRWGEHHGYRATIERSILGGRGSVDVALEGREETIAVEVSVTTSPKAELEHIRRCLAEGFDHVVAVADDERSQEQLDRLLDSELDDAERARVRALTSESLFSYLGELTGEPTRDSSTVRGYRVSVDYQPTDQGEARQKQRAISDVVASALRRRKE